MTAGEFNSLLLRFDNATPAERQQVLDMLPNTREPGPLGRELWERALSAVFEPDHHPL